MPKASRRLCDTGVMSPRQQRILTFIKEYLVEHGYAPSVREIADASGVHTSAVNYQLAELEIAGKIMRAERIARSIRVVER